MTLPLPPTQNAMYRAMQNGRGVYKTHECVAWFTEVQWIAKKHCRMYPKDTSYLVEVDIYYKFNRDIDSSTKSLLDALQGFAYENDSQVTRLVVTKQKDAKNPRLEVTVSPVLQ